MTIFTKFCCFIILALPHFNSFANNDRFTAKIAIVDVDTVLENSIAMAQVKKSINEISELIQKEMSSKELELKKLESDLTNQRNNLNLQEFEQKVLDFNKTVSRAKKLMQMRKLSLEKAHNKAMSSIHKAIIDIVGLMSKDHGFNIVFPSSQVLFIDSNLNITGDVTEKLNKQLINVPIDYKIEN
jgi:Skp family chaperone for outer membrane proteins